MDPFRSLPDFEEFIYTLRQQFPSIDRSTLLVARRGRRTATLQGEITLAQGYRVVVRERLSLDTGAVVIEDYGYEFWHLADKIAWYDAQPHPEDPSLADTYPHHKHTPPSIKHNRSAAPGMSFTRPNLLVLIREIEEFLGS